MSSQATTLLGGRAAVVLGADQIGTGIAQRLAREGASVFVLDPDRTRSSQGAAPIDFDAPETIAKAIDAAAQALGRLDILVCNTLPSASPSPLEAQSRELFEKAFKCVTAATRAMQAALPHLQASGAGRIIIVGSRYGDGVSDAIGAYNTAAWSLVGLTRTSAVDWGQYRIATNLLVPLARTDEFEAAQARRPGIINLMVSQVALGRVGDPVEDVGGAAVFLASDAASFVNGQVVYADGGQHIAGPVLSPSRFT